MRSGSSPATCTSRSVVARVTPNAAITGTVELNPVNLRASNTSTPTPAPSTAYTQIACRVG